MKNNNNLQLNDQNIVSIYNDLVDEIWMYLDGMVMDHVVEYGYGEVF